MALAEIERPEFIEMEGRERPAMEFGQILGPHVITNQMVDSWKRFDGYDYHPLVDIKGNPITSESISRKTGIERRYVVGRNETVLQLGEAAAQSLVGHGEVLDSVIFSTSYPVPGLNHADKLVEDLGFKSKATLEVSAACSGFARALANIHNNPTVHGKDLLIVTSEIYSRLNADLRRQMIEDDPTMAQLLFGDGAFAVRINGKKVDTLSSVDYHESSSSITMPRDFSNPVGNYDYTDIPNSEDHFRQNGGEVLRTVVKIIPEKIDQAITEAGLTAEDIDFVIPHQPSRPLLEALSKRSPHFKFLSDIEDGNYSSGSIPKVLRKTAYGIQNTAYQDGVLEHGVYRIKQGSNIVIAGFGAGFHAEVVVLQFH